MGNQINSPCSNLSEMKTANIKEFIEHGGLRPLRGDDIPDDLFIASASYEERTLAAAQLLSTSYRARCAIIYFNREVIEDPSSDKGRKNRDKLVELLARHCDRVDQVAGSWQEPKEQLLALRNALLPRDGGPGAGSAFTIDTTTFSRESLLTTMALLRTHYADPSIRVLYTSPSEHGSWLSQGFREVRNVMGFGGIQHSSLQTVLVVLSGFEPDRASRIIEEHEPAKVLLGIGDPPTKVKFLERNLNEQKLILARQEVERFSFPTSDISGCQARLEDLLRPYLGNYNVVLAPMSTKLSTLAVFLFAERHPEVQVTYCVPGEYNTEDYSTGADQIFIGELTRKNG
jgi:hypothetical protein